MFQEQALVREMSRLGRFAMRLTRNTHNAEDLLQATLLRAIEKKNLFEEGTNLFKWTSKLMFNIFVSGYRRKKKFETQYDPEPHISRMSVPPTQEVHVELIQLSDNLLRLNRKHQEIIDLVCIQQMHYAEAAKTLRVPVGTVRSRLSRARGELREIMIPAPRLPVKIHERIAA